MGEDYDGGREYDELKKFAVDNLKPLCSAANIHLCDGDKKKQLEGYMAMDTQELSKKAADIEAEMKEVSENFDAEVQKLQEQYEELEKTKTAKIAELKSSGLSMMKSVLASKPANYQEL